VSDWTLATAAEFELEWFWLLYEREFGVDFIDNYFPWTTLAGVRLDPAGADERNRLAYRDLLRGSGER